MTQTDEERAKDFLERNTPAVKLAITRKMKELGIIKTPTKPFTTDGCSGGMSWAWRRFIGHPPPWEGACIEHDKAYWLGGPTWKRRRADQRLREDVKVKGYPIIGFFMYYGVRLGGMSIWPVSWRWGYGYVWPESGE